MEKAKTLAKMKEEENVYMSMNRKKLNISKPLNIHPCVPFSPLSSIYDVPRGTERGRFTEIFPEPSEDVPNKDRLSKVQGVTIKTSHLGFL